MSLIETLEAEALAIHEAADEAEDPIVRQLWFAEWKGLRRAIFLAKHPDRCTK